MARSTTDLPGPLAKAAGRFESWRRARTGRRIPEELWRLAVGLGRRYGVSRTSRVLRLQYYTLKKRMEAAFEAPSGKASAPPAFVEFLTASSPVAVVSQVEFESPSGAKMRVEVNGTVSAGLVDLSRLFLREAR